MIAREQIAELIPHFGAMCLLDSVLHWDEATIRCRSRRHLAEDNPLRRAGQLSGVCGIEFAVQAMAVHGQLTAKNDQKPKAGYLASLRLVHCHHNRLDLLQDDLIIDAELLIGDGRRVIYRFALQAGDVAVLSGQAAVILDLRGP
jgi:predicted hotdog family 3-hydroxylacyl-ACP dehydratase